MVGTLAGGVGTFVVPNPAYLTYALPYLHYLTPPIVVGFMPNLVCRYNPALQRGLLWWGFNTP